MALNFSEYLTLDEGWKEFPKDKVNRQIEKKKKEGSVNHSDTHVMKTVSNYVTRSTDPVKRDSNYTKDSGYLGKAGERHAKDNQKANKKIAKAQKKQQKADAAGDDEKYAKAGRKGNKAVEKWKRSSNRYDGIRAVNMVKKRAYRDDNYRQAEVNQKSKDDKNKAKGMLKAMDTEKDRKKAEAAYKKPAVKGKTKGGFKKEEVDRLNFSQFLEATEGVEPTYQVEGETPRCPRGYAWDRKTKRCIPKTEKDSVSPDRGQKEMKPGNGPGYNTWGRTGLNGDGYAYEEPNNWEVAGRNGVGGM